MQLPRPYDNRWMIQGLLGVYDEDQRSVYLTGRSPKYHEWEPFAPYQDQYEHRWWKELRAALGEAGHGGTDYLELKLFVDAVREKKPTPIDIYDSVVMSCVIPLSEQSIDKRGAPVACPDFTRENGSSASRPSPLSGPEAGTVLSGARVCVRAGDAYPCFQPSKMKKVLVIHWNAQQAEGRCRACAKKDLTPSRSLSRNRKASASCTGMRPTLS